MEVQPLRKIASSQLAAARTSPSRSSTSSPWLIGGVADKLFVERAIERDTKHSVENFKAICEAEVRLPA